MSCSAAAVSSGALSPGARSRVRVLQRLVSSPRGRLPIKYLTPSETRQLREAEAYGHAAYFYDPSLSWGITPAGRAWLAGSCAAAA